MSLLVEKLKNMMKNDEFDSMFYDNTVENIGCNEVNLNSSFHDINTIQEYLNDVTQQNDEKVDNSLLIAKLKNENAMLQSLIKNTEPDYINNKNQSFNKPMMETTSVHSSSDLSENKLLKMLRDELDAILQNGHVQQKTLQKNDTPDYMTELMSLLTNTRNQQMHNNDTYKENYDKKTVEMYQLIKANKSLEHKVQELEYEIMTLNIKIQNILLKQIERENIMK
jgi:hypothetical protein